MRADRVIAFAARAASSAHVEAGAMVVEHPAPETSGIVIGNHVHKYTSKNAAIRWLTNRWVANLDATFGRIAADPASQTGTALEVGCGEGVISSMLQKRFGAVWALDLPDAGLRSEWSRVPGPHFLHADAHHLPFPDAQFDVVVSVEVLEHLTDPLVGLLEIARVARRHIILSVPREPIFRTCNLIAGRYVRDLGNTPGHLNHWSTPGFQRFVSSVADVREVTTPFPWTTVWATVRR
jgi:SAM-dependent methyltransferase